MTAEPITPQDKAREGIRLLREAIADTLRERSTDDRSTAVAALLRQSAELSASTLSPLEGALIQVLVELDQARARKPAEHTPRCPACGRIIYARRQSHCEFCNAELPGQVRLTREQQAQTDALFRAEWQEHLGWMHRETERARRRRANPNGAGGYDDGFFGDGGDSGDSGGGGDGGD
jgi:hypothetical protein